MGVIPRFVASAQPHETSHCLHGGFWYRAEAARRDVDSWKANTGSTFQNSLDKDSGNHPVSTAGLWPSCFPMSVLMHRGSNTKVKMSVSFRPREYPELGYPSWFMPSCPMKFGWSKTWLRSDSRPRSETSHSAPCPNDGAGCCLTKPVQQTWSSSFMRAAHNLPGWRRLVSHESCNDPASICLCQPSQRLCNIRLG